MLYRWLCVVVLICLVTVPGLAQEGSPAPDFTLKAVDGSEVSLASFKGKIVLIDFWAVWCPPCREEIPGFVEMAAKYKSKGVEIIGISLDKEINKVKAFIESNKINYPILSATKDVLKAYGDIQAIPTTFILDQDLKIVKKHVGFTEKAEFEMEIEALLAAIPEKKATPEHPSGPASEEPAPPVASAPVVASETAAPAVVTPPVPPAEPAPVAPAPAVVPTPEPVTGPAPAAPATSAAPADPALPAAGN